MNVKQQHFDINYIIKKTVLISSAMTTMMMMTSDVEKKS